MSITQPLNDTLPCYFMDGLEALRSGIRTGVFHNPRLNGKNISLLIGQGKILNGKEQYTFASINKSAPKYWATPRLNINNDDWTLILNNPTDCLLHVFYIPKNSINQADFTTVGKLKKQFRIDIDCENNPDFEDKGPGHVKFNKWYIETIHYTL